ncbi:putative lipid II flippase FtsW [Paraburkholderia sp. UCT31]|uniref:putative lipid II flippase FtsW n=1 Tax=Paraburkholderia sp. UCT31 TaxID=2615209 RepID=UPI001655D033|nr:putative lipid II flippase FtsW [Paraburkholderia sp. UCT31]MBC8739782.1 putative lipid II flippase FtsW [Paraburkholderia sp. UCT31]
MTPYVKRLLRTRPRARNTLIDYSLLYAALCLAAFGFVMVYSASIPYAAASKSTNHQPLYFVIRHGINLLLGGVVGFAVFKVPMRLWQRFAPWLFAFGLVLLAIVLVPHVGKVVNGSRRWISLGFTNLQPSETMKLFAVIFAADFISRRFHLMGSFTKGLLPLAAAIGLAGGLLLLEPDFGSTVVVCAITFGLLFLGGMPPIWFTSLAGVLGVGFFALIKLSPYRMARALGFLNPWADPLGKGYQLSHSLIAFGRGEVLGVGLGGSVEKLSYLPEAHTDFILAVVGEELGLVGVASVLSLFAVIVWKAFGIGLRAAKLERYFEALVAQGIAVWLGVQAFINIGVNIGLLPTKGLTLPLVSYGGSSLIMGYAALAVLLRIEYENRQLMEPKKESQFGDARVKDLLDTVS